MLTSRPPFTSTNHLLVLLSASTSSFSNKPGLRQEEDQYYKRPTQFNLFPVPDRTLELVQQSRIEEARLQKEMELQEKGIEKEQKKEADRLKKESKRKEKQRRQEEARKEKYAAKMKAANERALAKRLTKGMRDLVDDKELERMEAAAAVLSLNLLHVEVNDPAVDGPMQAAPTHLNLPSPKSHLQQIQARPQPRLTPFRQGQPPLRLLRKPPAA